jgi:hypothetical protein
VFLSDGIPNVKQSNDTTIDNYMTGKTGEWFTTGTFEYERNAVLMQVDQLKGIGWHVHAVGLGLGADRNLMDRMARMNGTAIPDPANPTGPRISPYAGGDPSDYQQRLTSIFEEMIKSKTISIVK